MDNDVEDDLTEIDPSNITSGGRKTHEKIIDYQKTAKELDLIKTKSGSKTIAPPLPTNKEFEDDNKDDDENDADFTI